MGTKKGTKRPDLSEARKEHTEPGDNAKYLSFALENMHMPPIDTSDPVQVEQRIDDYFDRCVKADLKPTVAGISASLGITTETFRMWCSGGSRSATHSVIVKKAKQTMEEMMEEYMQNGKINPVAGIFLMSNNFGYKQKVDVTHEVTQKDPLLEGRSAEELRSRYADVIDVEAEAPERPVLAAPGDAETVDAAETVPDSAADDDF